MSRGRSKGRGGGQSVRAWMGYLRGEGVAPGPVTPEVDAAAELLAGTSEEIPAVTGDVAAALGAALDEDGKVDLLVRCSTEGSRDLAKTARRALHAQRRRGANVPQVRSRGAAVPPGGGARDPHADARAHTTAPFGNGERILLFRFRGTTDRVLHAAMANLSDTLGLRELQLYRGGAKVYRTMVAQSSTQVAGAEVPFGWALHVLQGAITTTQQAGRLVPDHVATLRTMLGHDWPVSTDHPAAGLTASEVPADDALFALWERPELRTWITTEETLTELTASMGKAMESVLVINKQQRTERLVEILTQTVTAELEGLGQDLWAQRLGDAAWVMHQNQCGDEAAQVLAVRDQLLSTETPSDLAFFRQMVGRLLLGRVPQDVAAQLIPGLAGEPPPPETEPSSGLIIPGR